MFMLAVWLRWFAAGCLGIGVALVLDHFGLVAGGLLFRVGTVLRRRT
jgi:hypothetical protein